jgi:hypothetical protein
MKKADYKSIPDLLRNRESFTGSSVKAINDGCEYKVLPLQKFKTLSKMFLI